MTHLIADSGSTKTSWILTDGRTRQEFETMGINPVRDSEEEIERVVDQLINRPTPPPSFVGRGTDTTANEGNNVTAPLPTRERLGEGFLHLFFYGAGCIPPYSDVVRRVLELRFPEAEIHVESDLLGAAHALCGREEGIACILGTGSNSCLYDGRRIVENVSPLGWILGDEGSGAVLGRRLVGDMLKEQLSPALCHAFTEETGLTRTRIINKVYREPMPNRFLASLVPFLDRHRDDGEIRQFLVDEFRRFLFRNVLHYQRPDLPVGFVGGIASTFKDELAEALRLEGLSLGNILRRPIDAIADYLTTSKH